MFLCGPQTTTVNKNQDRHIDEKQGQNKHTFAFIKFGRIVLVVAIYSKKHQYQKQNNH